MSSDIGQLIMRKLISVIYAVYGADKCPFCKFNILANITLFMSRQFQICQLDDMGTDLPWFVSFWYGERKMKIY